MQEPEKSILFSTLPKLAPGNRPAPRSSRMGVTSDEEPAADESKTTRVETRASKLETTEAGAIFEVRQERPVMLGWGKEDNGDDGKRGPREQEDGVGTAKAILGSEKWMTYSGSLVL